MATFDGMSLTGDDGAPTAGAAFNLNEKSELSAEIPLDGSWTVEVAEGSMYVVARGGSEDSYENALREAHLRAESGLDLLTMKGAASRLTVNVDDDHLVWWPEKESLRLAVFGIVVLRITVPPVNVIVHDAHGKPRPPAPAPPIVPHESFRYFRRAQATDDLFDAYRNTFLAVESVLSGIEPMPMHTSGKPKEPEIKWLRRALTKADGLVDLSKYAPQSSPNPVQALIDELYDKTRTGLFHAKQGAQVLRPYDRQRRTEVVDALKRLTSLYLALVERHLGVRRPGGGMFAGFFRRQNEALLRDAVIVATDDSTPHDPTQTTFTPSGGRLIELKTRPLPEQSRGFQAMLFGESSGRELQQLSHLAMLGVRHADGTPLSAHWPEATVTLEGVRALEARLGIRGTNMNQPRDRYPS